MIKIYIYLQNFTFLIFEKLKIDIGTKILKSLKNN